MALSLPAVPPLPKRFLRNARLLPSRDDILPLLPKHAVIAEVGVMKGGFSRKILDVCKPSTFYAIDEYRVHTLPEVWGCPITEFFEGKTHRGFFESKFGADIATGVVKVLEGDSGAMLNALPDKSVDVIYLDADHNYLAVVRDLEVIRRKIKPVTGLIILNDYIMRDDNGPYGVIQAGHEFMLRDRWEMVAFCLEEKMYCDVVIRKLSDSRVRRIIQSLAYNLGYEKLGRF